MRSLYYPYLILDGKTANNLVSWFGELFLLTPVALRSHLHIPQVKFIDPLPETWKQRFGGILTEYRLFSQMYTDRSFLEYLKHAHPFLEDEESPSVLRQFLKGKEKKGEELPKQVIATLFLYLANEYQEQILDVYKRLQEVKKQEEMLKSILEPSSELNIGEITSLTIDYRHPEEDLRNWMDKVFKAWAFLIPAEEEFPIFITDDELAHQHLKHALKDTSHFIYNIYLPANGDEALWGDLIEIPFTSDFESWAEKLFSFYKKPTEDTHPLEIIFLPCLSPKDVFLWITEKKEIIKRKKNGLFILWQDKE
ncbi:MAG: hypothetical protein KCCBMMGE_00420 [Candidatus Methanoperedenaceae archaeon GB37]|nr:MAG: hypothetical protein KCCBMMGE_00420 [Candidatus Methanoperedenaceae archaeon GB37]CAD7777158.1 hypothetical protein DMNBHIDG_01430 [Candidatus Methanoperedenaceae archaeon GB37]